jgi:mono/diheme cytochrome c family protein
MRSILWFLAGLAAAAAILAASTALFLKTTAQGFSANAPATPLEAWAARQARTLAIPKTVKETPNPVPDTPETLQEARAHWADHCASCHGNDGKGQTEMGPRLYPPAPDMTAQTTQRLSDGELFYIIQNGIRLTGMPGWGAAHTGEEDSWKLVRFIRHLPSLSPSELQNMEKLNPKSPHELEEEQQEEQFLKGEPNSATPQHPRHH